MQGLQSVSDPACDKREVSIATPDGQSLAGTYYVPTQPSGVAALVNGGIGIPRGFYDAFAQRLAARGVATLTYDYRGMGGSAAEAGTMEDWGRIDQVASLDFLAAQRPLDALTVVGHSFGGQVLGLASNVERVRAAFLVASQTGHWRYWGWPRKARMWLTWWVLIPVLTRLYGKFPGAGVIAAPLPAGVALDLARWSRNRDYICDRRGRPLRPYNARITFPIRWLSFSDDESAPFAAVEALRGYYPHAQQERLHLTPQDFGLPAVGHFGFFRRSMPVAQWDTAAEWLMTKARS